MLKQEALERPSDSARPSIHLQGSRRSGEKVIETEGLVVAHPGDGTGLFSVPNLSLMRGERVAVLGPNGAGKTSLLRTLLGETAPFGGDVRLGPSVRPGYLAQTEAELRSTDRVLDCLRQVAGDIRETDAMSWLARLGLADDADKTVEQLSGGERRRLALARLSLAGANLLLLDEPTNNLDLPAQEALQAGLSAFAETILMATHDRYLARALATQVWVISPNEASLEVFRGTLDEYLAARDARRAAAAGRTRSVGRAPPEQRGQRRTREVADLEERIGRLEQDLKSLADEIDHARGDARKVMSLGIEYARREGELEQLLETWAQTSAEGSA
jgi:ATP-binding cassette subfamily F protein 3